MLFNSIQFIIFFPAITLTYFVIPHKFRYVLLLLASYFFYMCWNPKYALILLASTVITYASGLLIGKSVKNKTLLTRKRLLLILSIIFNLSILGFFKYFNFAINNINAILAHFGISLLEPRFDIVLPVGISFYTFKAMSYIIDVYRGDIKPERNFMKYALYVSFFPQLMSGPIERPAAFLSQINKKHDFDYERVKSGLLIMAWGYFLKMVLSDRMALLANEVFDNFTKYSGFQLALGAVFFGLQIYCDFSSYSSIAVGVGKVLGFSLMENFNTPYFSTSVAEFWRRWHISLSTWFRDYLYIPLGGNRKGKLRKYINIIIVFLVSGLWHGASWNFVIWGGLNGLYQVFGDILRPIRNWITDKTNFRVNTFSNKLIKIITTFVLIDFSWIFFRAEGAKAACLLIKRMFSNFNPYIFFDGSIFELGLDKSNFAVTLTALVILLFISICKYNGISLQEKLSQQNTWFRWLIYYMIIFSVLIFGIYGPAYNASSFIYSQF
ncbi:MAG TPA: MBOAT family protein [Bacillales bacterium]|nr:MBOAT family protein [Bacillales bacterium]